MKILFIGDIVGHPGRQAVRETLPEVVAEHAPDLILANGENAAAGFGITPALVDELLDLGIEVLTSGNHIWDRKEIVPYFAGHADGRLLRPANFPDGSPGHGLYLGRTRAGVPYAVINLQGRVFMTSIDCPFRMADELLASVAPEVKIRIVDVHAEATSEKIALGWYLDGQVTAVLGTHTHVPTADERVLPRGTAYITDLGMTGPYDSVIGRRYDRVLAATMSFVHHSFDVASGGPQFHAARIEVDPATGRALAIERVAIKQEDLPQLLA